METASTTRFDLYTVDLPDMETIVERTEGASGAFIRELMRRAALFAADEDRTIVVRSKHIDGALHELVFEGGSLTRNLLGVPTMEPPHARAQAPGTTSSPAPARDTDRSHAGRDGFWPLTPDRDAFRRGAAEVADARRETAVPATVRDGVGPLVADFGSGTTKPTVKPKAPASA